MKYIVCEKPGQFLLKEKKAPTCNTGEVLLKITAIGICGTDLHAYAGNQPFFSYPRILGHELAAEVVESKAVSRKFNKGDKLIIMPYVSCQKCIACRSGKTNCCISISVLGVHEDGGMQEHIVVPEMLLLPAEGLEDPEIALVEPLAIGAHAIQRADVKKDEFVLVIGCGPIGLGIIKLAQLEGAKVIAMDINELRLKFAKNKFGVNHLIKADSNALENLKQITKGDLATAVFDATGNKKALESGITYMSHGGRYILVGLSKGNLNFNHPDIHAKESTIICSRNANMEDFKRVKKMLQSGQFPSEDFITHKVDFTEMIEHFEDWTLPETGVIKAMVYF